MSDTKKYKWDSPAAWLIEKTSEWTPDQLLQEFFVLVQKLDSDTIQDIYQSDMNRDGYFVTLCPHGVHTYNDNCETCDETCCECGQPLGDAESMVRNDGRLSHLDACPEVKQ